MIFVNRWQVWRYNHVTKTKVVFVFYDCNVSLTIITFNK